MLSAALRSNKKNNNVHRSRHPIRRCSLRRDHDRNWHLRLEEDPLDHRVCCRRPQPAAVVVYDDHHRNLVWRRHDDRGCWCGLRRRLVWRHCRPVRWRTVPVPYRHVLCATVQAPQVLFIHRVRRAALRVQRRGYHERYFDRIEHHVGCGHAGRIRGDFRDVDGRSARLRHHRRRADCRHLHVDWRHVRRGAHRLRADGDHRRGPHRPARRRAHRRGWLVSDRIAATRAYVPHDSTGAYDRSLARIPACMAHLRPGGYRITIAVATRDVGKK